MKQFERMPQCLTADDCARTFPKDSILTVNNQHYQVVGYFYDYDGEYVWWPQLDGLDKWHTVLLLKENSFSLK